MCSLYQTAFVHPGRKRFLQSLWHGRGSAVFSQRWEALGFPQVYKPSMKGLRGILWTVFSRSVGRHILVVYPPPILLFVPVPVFHPTSHGEPSVREVCFSPWTKEGRTFLPKPFPIPGKKACVLLSPGCTGGIISCNGWRGVRPWSFLQSIQPLTR